MALRRLLQGKIRRLEVGRRLWLLTTFKIFSLIFEIMLVLARASLYNSRGQKTRILDLAPDVGLSVSLDEKLVIRAVAGDRRNDDRRRAKGVCRPEGVLATFPHPP